MPLAVTLGIPLSKEGEEDVNAQTLHYRESFKKEPRFRDTIAVDFDGVLNSYTTKMGLDKQHLLPDPPVPGALDWVNEMVQHYNVVVFTCRAQFSYGVIAVKKWLDRHGFPPLEVTGEKPIAMLYLDDRGYLFTGIFPSLDYV